MADVEFERINNKLAELRSRTTELAGQYRQNQLDIIELERKLSTLKQQVIHNDFGLNDSVATSFIVDNLVKILQQKNTFMETMELLRVLRSLGITIWTSRAVREPVMLYIYLFLTPRLINGGSSGWGLPEWRKALPDQLLLDRRSERTVTEIDPNDDFQIAVEAHTEMSS